MNWISRALLGGIFVLMATITVSAYDFIGEEPYQETVLEKNVISDREAALNVSMADEPGLCLMSETLDCVKITNVTN